MAAPRSADFDPDELLRHVDWVRRLARGLARDAAEAEDLAQGTLAAALERRPGAHLPLAAWLRTVLLRRAADRRRAAARRHRREAIQASRRVAGAESAAEVVERVEIQRVVAEAALALPEPYRRTILWRYFEGWKPREIAQREGVPVSTVEPRLRRGRELLRDRLARLDSAEGKAWLPALLGLASPAAPLARAGRGGVLLGTTILMGNKLKLGILTAALLFGAWALTSGQPAIPSAPGTGVDPLEPAAAARGAVEHSGGEAAVRTPVLEGSTPRPAAFFIREEGGTAVAGARFVVFQSDGEILQRGRSDEAGSAEWVDHGGSPKLLIAAEGHAHWLGRPPVAGGAVLLPRGEALSGLVVVDGAPPGEELPLELRSRRRLLPGVPREVLVAAAVAPMATGTLTGSCAADGSFRFAGLPADWSGSLSCTDERFLADGQNPRFFRPFHQHAVAGPRPDLVLALHRTPAVRGRILQRDGAPWPGGGQVSAQVHYRGGSLTSVIRVGPIGGDGRFELPLREEELAHDRVEVWAMPTGLPHEAWTVDPAPADLDLGDFVLAPHQILRVVARTAGGAPIEGVQLQGIEPYTAVTDPAEAGQPAVIALAPSTRALLVAADGFGPRQLELDAAALPERLEVVLDRTQQIRVSLRDPAGAPFTRGQVVLSGVDLTAPVGEGQVADPDIREGRLSLRGGGRPAEWWIAPSAAGEVRVQGLRPGGALQLRVYAEGSALLHEETIDPVPADGSVERTVVVEAAFEVFRGQVVDPRGRGVRPEKLSLSFRDPAGLVWNPAPPACDEEGYFALEVAAGSRVSVSVEAAPWAPYFRDGLEVPEEGEVVELALEEGVDLMVYVTDTEGDPVPAVVEAFWSGGREWGRRVEPDGHRIPNLPLEPLWIRAMVGGVAHERQVGLWRSYVLVLPVHGAVEVDLSARPEIAGLEGILALRLSPVGGGEPRRANFRFGTREVPAVLPGEYLAEIVEKDWGPWTVVSEAVPVTVEAGKAAVLKF